MSGNPRYEPKGRLGRLVHGFEEGMIAFLLGMMTILTFVNVVLRYVFNGLNIWSLEVVSILFAWLVLFGIAYGFKVTMHLGVDAMLNILSPGPRRLMGMLSALVCVFYALLILKGAWDYWAPFAALPETTGRWFPTGFDPNTRDRAFFETDQVPMLSWLRWLEGAINQGETYSKLPRVVPYVILPLSALLILWRIIEATARIFAGRQENLIVSHEAEDAVEDVAAHRDAEI
ncbi:TRAP transporter small permease [Frigidibacter sp. ROC022]|uniref:TRAP transporter small permease n=1 Tax=Frigidibacter sp. ROC022 TaxID=2971796 RepID=UPI00215A81F2|nr:TRAP transporter small permease [Frigidibacter sp. ROC022]MCR8725565.1 TRAP transporter small permease [Frigidibacter sp. ROC022]